MITITAIDESYTILSGDRNLLNDIYNFLKVQRQGAYYEKLVQKGLKSPFNFYASWVDNDTLLLYSGNLSLLGKFGIKPFHYKSNFTENNIDSYLNSISLPFEPYDYQIKAFKESILNVRQLNILCTGSGKSLTISLICDFYRTQNKKGLLIVPNINLLTQFKSDIQSYNLIDLYKNTKTLGDGISKIEDCDLLISTWQSMIKHKDEVNNFDYIICDECLEPNTKIRTINGEKSIKDIKNGEKVLSFNEKTLKNEYKEVVKKYKDISKCKEVYKFTLENDTTLIITGNHKIMTNRGWIRADEITVEDELYAIS